MGVLSVDAGAAAGYDAARAALVQELREERRAFDETLGREGFSVSDRALEAIARVPRHEFVPEPFKPHAYENRPLAIGSGQTISQPFIVALMTELLRLKPGDRVLEIGTGSGYQTAVLAELTQHVYTIEIIPELGHRSAEVLARLGYKHITAKVGDGYLGWPEEAPFDAIIVTAAPTRIPPPLLAQLKPGGRLVIPVGDVFATQSLLLVSKAPNGRITTREVLPVAFVPLTGDH
jgi:protein-L-isoaspartate(D-aspartate) O-methyltransferase